MNAFFFLVTSLPAISSVIEDSGIKQAGVVPLSPDL